MVKNDNKEYEFFLANYNGEKYNILGMDILKNKKIVFDCEKMKLGLYGENIFNVEKEAKEETPIIPKEDEDKEKKEKEEKEKKEKEEKERKEKEEKERKEKEEKEKKEKEEKERKEKEEKEKKEKEKANSNNNNQNNQNNQNNNNINQGIQTNEEKSGGSVFKKILIFIVVVLVLFISWNLFKRYQKRRIKMKSPFQSYNEANFNGIQLISDQ